MSLVILMLTLGGISLKNLPIDLYPDVTLPTVVVVTSYAGAGPQDTPEIRLRGSPVVFTTAIIWLKGTCVCGT